MPPPAAGPARPAAEPEARPVTVVGIGADGWPGLPERSRQALLAAAAVAGSPRQLDLLPDLVRARRLPWPTPLRPAVADLVAEHAGAGLAVLASGDPMWHGVGRTLAEVVGPHRLRVLPHPSSVSLACAALGWAVEDVEVVSLVTAPVQALRARLFDGERVLVLGRDAATPAAVTALLAGAGFGPTRVTVLSSLGGPEESVVAGTADGWDAVVTDPLSIIALEVRADPAADGPGCGPALSVAPGLADDAFDHDGQITKREVRALTLSSLAPAPGQLLWDIGSGSGSVAIEWLRAHRRCRAVAVEQDPGRSARVAANAARLGVPGLSVVTGAAPAALDGLPAPDAVFIGGGLTRPGVLSACWRALGPGGRLVANAVTLETESAVLDGWRRLGGDLTRIEVSRAGPVGSFTTWRPALPVVQWRVTKAGVPAGGPAAPDTGPDPEELA